MQPESGRPFFQELLDLSSPLRQFIEEDCVIDDPMARTPREKLFDAYKRWCFRKNQDDPLSLSGFGVELRSVVPNLGDTHPVIEGERVRYYTGIALKG